MPEQYTVRNQKLTACKRASATKCQHKFNIFREQIAVATSEPRIKQMLYARQVYRQCERAQATKHDILQHRLTQHTFISNLSIFVFICKFGVAFI